MKKDTLMLKIVDTSSKVFYVCTFVLAVCMVTWIVASLIEVSHNNVSPITVNNTSDWNIFVMTEEYAINRGKISVDIN